MTETTPIDRFSGRWAPLSNFQYAHMYGGYTTVEHVFQASKAQFIHEARWVRDAPSPGDAKRRGRQVVLRPDWEDVKLLAMETALREKFNPNNPGILSLLLSTGTRELIEGNTWNDRYWGVCRGQGENHLGRLLMKIRGELL